MTYQVVGIRVVGRSVVYHDLRFEKVPIRCTSSRGSPYVRWIDIGMPQIPLSFLNCVFFLYANENDAKRGLRAGGTGFIMAMPSEDGRGHHYGVTNYHVAVSGGCSCIRLNTTDGKVDTLTFGPEDWYFIPGKDDVAVVPLDFSDTVGKFFLTFIGTNLIHTAKSLASDEIGPGDDVFMAGRFIDIDAKETNTVSVRFGNISTVPVPIEQPNDYIGDCYCVDMHSRTGYSGSPVFVYRTPGSSLKWIVGGGPVQLAHANFALLGIHCGQFKDELPIKGRRKERKTREAKLASRSHEEYIEGMSGMTIVIPAERILDILNLPELAALRAKEVEMRKQDGLQQPKPVPEIAAPVDPRGGDEILRAALNTPPLEKPKAKGSKRGRGGVSSK